MNEIGLQDLIYQVKQELLAPNPAQRAKDPYPLFFVDKVEIEVAVKVQKEASGGVKISVLSFAELNASGSATQERGHIVKVSLSPLLSKEEILAQLLKDPQIAESVKKEQREALLRDVPLAGTPE